MKTETLKPPKIKKENKVKKDYVKWYNIILCNDDINEFDFILEKIQEVFHIKENDALKIVTEAHKKERALISTEPFEHAEMKQEKLAGYKIYSEIEPV